MNTSLAVTLVAASVLAIPAPASADVLGGSVRHYSPDYGYDLPILVDCAGLSGWQRVPEGGHSDHICGPDGSEDVNRVKVRNDGEKISCWAGDSWYVLLNGATDPDNIASIRDIANVQCVTGLVGR